MKTDTGIRFDQKTPPGYKRLETASCDRCNAQFAIIHEEHFPDVERAKKQATFLKSYLAGEHVDDKFKEHLDRYEDLEEA